MKRRILCKWIILLLVIYFVCVFFAGCNSKEEYKDISDLQQAKSVDGSDLFLVKNRQSDYKIVICSTADIVETKAANCLADYIYKSTKCRLPIVYDNQITMDNYSKFIVVGETNFTKNSGITINFDDLGDDGYIITLKSDSLFIIGANGIGTLYGVYGYLADSINYEAYAVDEIAYDQMTSIPMCVYDNKITVPDFQYRAVTYGDIQDPEDGCIMKLVAYNTLYANEWTMGVHAVPDMCPREQYPDWYKSGGQLCMSIDEPIDYIVDKTMSHIKGNPKARFFMLGHGDTPGTCTCDLCRANEQMYGGQGGIYIKWINKVAEKIETKMAEEGLSERKIYILALAYQGYQDAPVVSDGKGGFSPVNSEVVCRDNVGVYYAPIYSCYAHALDDPNCEINRKGEFANNLKGWASLTQTLLVHTYCAEYFDYLFPYNDYASLSGNYKLFKETGVYGVKDEMFIGCETSPFSALKIYLRSKMLWDTTLDINALMNKFFTNYYKEAAPYVREYFDAIRDHYDLMALKYQTNGCYVFNSIGGTGSTAYRDYAKWGYDLLMKYKEILSKAYKAISDAGYSAEDYEMMRLRIRADEMFVMHYLINNYSSYYTADEYRVLKTAYDRDVELLGIHSFGG